MRSALRWLVTVEVLVRLGASIECCSEGANFGSHAAVERLRLVFGRLWSLWPMSPERGTRHPDAKRA